MLPISDSEWEQLEGFIPKKNTNKDGRGRPARDRREVLNGVLFILVTGIQWHYLPANFPPYQTCHRYFQEWVRAGVLTRIVRELMNLKGLTRRERRKLMHYIDAMFVPAKKGAQRWARPSGVKVLR
jgi:transposase